MFDTRTYKEHAHIHSGLGFSLKCYMHYFLHLTSYHSVSVKVSPRGYKDRTHVPVQSERASSGVSAVHSVGSPGAYLPNTPRQYNIARVARVSGAPLVDVDLRTLHVAHHPKKAK